MTKRIVSWVLVGVFAYTWWWGGFQWPYLAQIEGAGNVYILFTLIALVFIGRGARLAGPGMFDGPMNGIKRVGMNLHWFLLAFVVGEVLYFITVLRGFSVEMLIQGLVLVAVAVLLTSLWAGAIDGGSD